MKTIVLHDKYSNEPMVVRPEAIVAIRKFKNIGEDEFSNILVDTVMFDVKESIGTVIIKIKEAESEDE